MHCLDLQAFGLNETINTTASDGYTVVGEALKSKTTHLVTREITRGKTGTNEIQHVVGVDATTLADMANSTVSLNDGNGQTVTVDFTNAPADIDALRDAITAKITSHDGVAGNTDFGLAITDGLSGTDLVMTFDLAGQTAAQNVTMASFSYTKTASGLETSIAKGDLTLNGVEIFNTDIASNSFGGKLNLINSFSAETGVVASATFDQTFVVDPNNIIKGDVVKINGTEVEVTASNDIAALITALNARTDSTGLTASRSGNNITFKGENVQSLTIGQKSNAEISDTLVSEVNAKGASNAVDRTLTIDASDLQAGRTYAIAIANSGDAEAPDVSVTVTATSSDTTSTLATKIADAIRGANEKYRDGTDATNISVSSNVITFNGASGSKLDAGQADITFKTNAVGDIFGTSDGAEVTSYGSLKLDSTANTPIKIDLGEVTTAANHKRLHGFLEANVGAADYDVNEPQLSASGGTSMAGLSVGTASGATQALATIDRAMMLLTQTAVFLALFRTALSTQSTTCHRSRTQQVARRVGSWMLILPRKLLS